jgi:hypothetical protein
VLFRVAGLMGMDFNVFPFPSMRSVHQKYLLFYRNCNNDHGAEHGLNTYVLSGCSNGGTIAPRQPALPATVAFAKRLSRDAEGFLST